MVSIRLRKKQLLAVFLVLQLIIGPFIQSVVFAQAKTVVQENISISQEEFTKAHEKVKKLETVELGKFRTLTLKAAFFFSKKRKRTKPPSGLYDCGAPPTDKEMADYEKRLAEDTAYNDYNNYVAEIERANKLIEDTKKDFNSTASDLSKNGLEALSDPVKLQKSIDKALEAQRKHQEAVIEAGNDIIKVADSMAKLKSNLFLASVALKAAAGILTVTGVGLALVPALTSMSAVIDKVTTALAAGIVSLTAAGNSLIESGELGKTTDDEYKAVFGVNLLQEGARYGVKKKFFAMRGKLVGDGLKYYNNSLPIDQQYGQEALKTLEGVTKYGVGQIPGQTKFIDAGIDKVFDPKQESDLIEEIYIDPAFKEQRTEKIKSEISEMSGKSTFDIILDKNPKLDLDSEEDENILP
jgi:hypothetical protein